MADILSNQDPNSPNNQGQTGSQAPTVASAPGSVSTSGGMGTGNLQAPVSTPASSGGKGSAAPTVAAPSAVTRQGTGFTNIQRIAQASEGNQLGNTLAGDITGQLGQVGSGITQAQSDFQKQAQSSFPTISSTQQQEINNTLQNAGGATPQQLSDIRGLITSSYGGPTQLGNLSGLQSQAAQAQALGQLAGTSGGQQALLQQFVGAGQPGYSSGRQMLDLALLGQSPQTALNQARQQSTGLSQQLGTAEQQAEQQATALQQQAQQQASGLKNQFTGVQQGLLGQAETAKQAAQTQEQQRASTYTGVTNDINSGNYQNAIQKLQAGGYLNPTDAATLSSVANYGLSPDKIKTAFQNAITNTAATPTSTNAFLSPQQAASLNALQQLTSGTAGTYQPGQYTAGTLGINTGQVASGLGQQLAEQQAADQAAQLATQQAAQYAADHAPGGKYGPPAPAIPVGQQISGVVAQGFTGGTPGTPAPVLQPVENAPQVKSNMPSGFNPFGP